MSCLNPFDVQSRHIMSADGTAEALYAGCGTRGGQQYVLQRLKKRGKEMTKLDAIQILCAYGTPQDEDQFREALNIAIKALSAKSQEWISVENRLPEPQDRVLVQYKSGKMDVNYRVDWACKGKLITEWNRNNDSVIVWQPLPKQYKGV